jgi:hypothetical protein
MDAQTALLGTGTGGTLLGLAVLLYKFLNHKRCRSRCCGWNGEMGLDIDSSASTPPNEKSFIVDGAKTPETPSLKKVISV